MGVAPAEMEGPAANTLVNAFQGTVTLGTGTYNAQANAVFYISYGNMGREACVQMITSDWGSGASSGFVGMTVGNGGTGITTAVVPAVSANTKTAGAAIYGNLNLPVTPADAATSCQCTNDQCIITWYYM